MNVYIIKAYGRYGGGMAIVAASDEYSAINIAKTIKDTTWHTNYGNPESVTRIPVAYGGDDANVIDHYETGE